MFAPIVDALRAHDPFLVLADYSSYIECQQRVSEAWHDVSAWTRMSILNTARSGKFSSTAPSPSTARRFGACGRSPCRCRQPQIYTLAHHMHAHMMCR